jgi:hypothetical protein
MSEPKHPERFCNGGPHGVWCGKPAELVCNVSGFQWFACSAHTEGAATTPIAEWFTALERMSADARGAALEQEQQRLRAIFLPACKQDLSSGPCIHEAAYRYTWPGKGESFICNHCAPKLLAVAAAMAFDLELIPLFTPMVLFLAIAKVVHLRERAFGLGTREALWGKTPLAGDAEAVPFPEPDKGSEGR